MKTYSFLDVNCAMIGPGLALDLSAGAGLAQEGISFAFSADTNTTTIGADGLGMQTLKADKSGTISVRVLKSSPLNQSLSLAYAFQRTSSAAHGQNTITLVDRNKGDNVTAQNVAFQRAPNLDFGAEAQIVEWLFSAVSIDFALGS